LQNGLQPIVCDGTLVTRLLDALENETQDVRSDTLFLLTAVARSSEKGHEVVLAKARCGLQALVSNLVHSADHDYLSTTLEFINALLAGITNRDDRKQLMEDIGIPLSEELCTKLLEAEISNNKLIKQRDEFVEFTFQ
jgi:hypothetical protein